ncbi:MAG: hypothetical protein DMG47_15820 [Acidobacteria bacterium]|nr:MAG: hypothetical protein DMG47_15820 [Acidobacteriota bacterium]
MGQKVAQPKWVMPSSLSSRTTPANAKRTPQARRWDMKFKTPAKITSMGQKRQRLPMEMTPR